MLLKSIRSRIVAIAMILGVSSLPLFESSLVQAATALQKLQKPDSKAATQPVQADGGWPRSYTTPTGAKVVIYTPQVASWDNQKLMVLYAAVAYSPTNAMPVFGSIKAEVKTKVALDERLVELSEVKITDSNFPQLAKAQVQEIVTQISSGIPTHERVFALERVLASVNTSQIIPKNVEGVKADPPIVFFSKTPALLVNIDGEPVWSAIPKNDLKYAINTNWDLFEHAPTKTFYLRQEMTWLTAPSVMGPWSTTETLPGSFSKLPMDDNWKDVESAVPPMKGLNVATPKVFVSTRPAELILLQGEPKYLAVGTTKLLWVSNTESDVFRMGGTGSVYYLVAGRWFSAPDFSGPWSFATPSLPAEFRQIPLGHERSRVLASVPGTPQAAEAVLLAQIPQTARVNKKELKASNVVYQGAPSFKPINGTTLSYAENTDKDIVKVGDIYYMCFQGVWFKSTNPSGPWEVASSVPEEIYNIPIGSPVHNVTYVTVENQDDDWAEFAATAAYTGTMVAWGTAVWGDGYYYDPYWGYGGYYPAYLPRYPTYGYGAWYNPWTGTYGRGIGAYGPYGGAGAAARYNPSTGTYSRGAAAYGPVNSRAVASAYNPRTGTAAATRQGSGVYGNWGTTAVRRGDQWARSAHFTSDRTGHTTGAIRTGQGDVYAGRDGNVYRKQGDAWQKYNNGSWNNVGAARDRQAPDSSTLGQLKRDSSVRAEGATRTRDQGSIRSGSSQRTGSFRSSGGFSGGGSFRGGGGFRGCGGRRR